MVSHGDHKFSASHQPDVSSQSVDKRPIKQIYSASAVTKKTKPSTENSHKKGQKAPAKYSYTVPCASRFRDAVLALAEKRQVNAGDLARATLLVVSPNVIAQAPDPGEPTADDRETVVLQSGAHAGRVLKRKPRLQVRLPRGYDLVTIRRALGFALSLERQEMLLHIEGFEQPQTAATAAGVTPPPPPEPVAIPTSMPDDLAHLRDKLLQVAFEPLEKGVATRLDALYVLGFPLTAWPDEKELEERYRALSLIFDPQGPSPYLKRDGLRMKQIEDAVKILWSYRKKKPAAGTAFAQTGS